MIKKLASVSMALLLSACASKMPHTVSYEISAKTYAPEDLIVFKSNGSDCDLYTGEYTRSPLRSFRNRALSPEEHLSCTILPEGTVPGEIQIEYGKWLSKDHEKKEYVVIQDMPDSYLSTVSWNKIILHPNDLVEKYKEQVPQYPVNARMKYSEGKKLNYLIQLNPDGSYVVEDRLERTHPRVKKKESKPGLIYTILYGLGSMQ